MDANTNLIENNNNLNLNENKYENLSNNLRHSKDENTVLSELLSLKNSIHKEMNTVSGLFYLENAFCDLRFLFRKYII
jgi:hypothetical protein